jgi:hypothetical protein
VEAFKPEMELVKAPVPVPSLVQVSAVVGVPEVFQQTPCSLTLPPPSEVTLPPEDALELVMEDADAVVTVGETAPMYRARAILSYGAPVEEPATTIFPSYWIATWFP